MGIFSDLITFKVVTLMRNGTKRRLLYNEKYINVFLVLLD